MEAIPYDYFTHGGDKVSLVQVKTTQFFRESWNAYQLDCSGSNKRKYTKKECDFIAVYLSPEDRWYILPVTMSKRNIYFKKDLSQCKYKYYADAWYLLKGERSEANGNAA